MFSKRDCLTEVNLHFETASLEFSKQRCMKIRFINFVLFLITVSGVFSQQSFTIQVKNQKKEVVEYPEISIPKKTHKIGTKEGTLLLSKNDINAGDSIIVSHLSYETEIFLIDNEVINRRCCEIILYEKTYFLEPVVVNRNDFNAEAFFKKKKKNLLLPYFKEYHFNADFEFVAGGQSSKKGNVACHFKNASVNIDTVGINFSDETDYKDILIRGLKRASEINYLAANIFCHSKYRKRFYCDYKGEENNFDLWEFVIRPNNDMLWNLNKEDEFRCYVYLDNNGIIARIDVHLTSHSESGISYLLETDYVLFDRKLVASETMMKLLPNAINNDTPELLVKINYSDFQVR